MPHEDAKGSSQDFSTLLPPSGRWKQVIHEWLQEDVPKFDIGGFVVGRGVTTARLLGKTPGVLAGVPFANEVFEALGCEIEWLLNEGEEVTPEAAKQKAPVAVVHGPVNRVLLGERTALNILSRASGIATQAREASTIAAQHGWHGVVAGTRKTTPGFGFIEKYAILVGRTRTGHVATHRMDLSSMVMLKDNHVWAAGSIAGSVSKAKQATGVTTMIEVECRTLEEAREAATAGAHIIMLDNFEPEVCKQAAAALKKEYPHVICEASRGIRVDTMAPYFSPDIDVISQGSMTQGYSCLDYSLKVSKPDGFELESKLRSKY